LKKQSQFIRIASCLLRIAKTNLKKQSQFDSGQIGAYSYMKGTYGNKPACGARKNKAKQSQFQTGHQLISRMKRFFRYDTSALAES
jgi:hypothetical protein